jgi:O-antigen ligase
MGVALFSISVAPFLEIYPFLGQTPLRREIRALLTLVIGVSFYFVASVYPMSENRLRSSLRWLYLGAILTLFWSSIQAFFVFRNIALDIVGPDSYPNLVSKIHRFFSIRDLFAQRVTGLTYEPSFLADQLVVLFLPLWLASIIKRYSVFSSKRTIYSVELWLVLWGLLVLFLSQSRIGILSAFALLGCLGVVGAWKLAGILLNYLQTRIQTGNGIRIDHSTHSWFRYVIFSLFVLLILAMMFAVVVLASRFDPRVEELFEINYRQILEQYDEPIYDLASKLGYAERLMYWTGGFRVFSRYPILGIGLGNAGFEFLGTVPSYGYRLPEIIHIVSGSPQFPNPKNLWIRILAETGVAGFSLFLIWMLLLGLGAWSLLKRREGIWTVLGLAGLLALLAQVLEGFSLDTFALPQLWIMLGLLTTAITLMLRSEDTAKVTA